MERVRTFGAILAILAAMAAVLFLQLGATRPALVLIVAAGCLAIVVPFRAPYPPHRKRVVAGCFAYTLGATGAAVWAAQGDMPRSQLAILAGLAIAGFLLSCWAFATRNRRQRPSGLRAYYER